MSSLHLMQLFVLWRPLAQTISRSLPLTQPCPHWMHPFRRLGLTFRPWIIHLTIATLDTTIPMALNTQSIQATTRLARDPSMALPITRRHQMTTTRHRQMATINTPKTHSTMDDSPHRHRLNISTSLSHSKVINSRLPTCTITQVEALQVSTQAPTTTARDSLAKCLKHRSDLPCHPTYLQWRLWGST